MRKATELGTAIFLCVFTLFFMALVMASSLFCSLVRMRFFSYLKIMSNVKYCVQ